MRLTENQERAYYKLRLMFQANDTRNVFDEFRILLSNLSKRYTVRECADFLGISKSTVSAWQHQFSIQVPNRWNTERATMSHPIKISEEKLVELIIEHGSWKKISEITGISAGGLQQMFRRKRKKNPHLLNRPCKLCGKTFTPKFMHEQFDYRDCCARFMHYNCRGVNLLRVRLCAICGVPFLPERNRDVCRRCKKQSVLVKSE